MPYSLNVSQLIEVEQSHGAQKYPQLKICWYQNSRREIRPLENDPDQHPDDHLVKGLFKKHAAGILPYLMPGLTIIEPLEDDGIIEIVSVSQGQHEIDPLIRENPFVKAIVAEEVAKRRIKRKVEGLQEGILDIVSDCFPAPVVSRIQQSIASSQDVQQLQKFLCHVVQTKDEQEVFALLTECFPPDNETKPCIEYTYVQAGILDVASDHFSSQVVTQVQHAIAPVQDIEQLRDFLRQLVRVSDEQEVYALLAQHFPTYK